MKSFKESILSNHSKDIFALGTTSWEIMLQEFQGLEEPGVYCHIGKLNSFDKNTPPPHTLTHTLYGKNK